MEDRNNSNNVFGLAVVGCGQIVTHHLDAIATFEEEFRVVALCDQSSDRRNVLAEQRVANQLTGEQPAAQYNMWDELIVANDGAIEKIDFVFTAVPHDLHEAIATTAALNIPARRPYNNKNRMVVLENPLAPTKEACDRLVQASVESEGRLVIAEQSPHGKKWSSPGLLFNKMLVGGWDGEDHWREREVAWLLMVGCIGSDRVEKCVEGLTRLLVWCATILRRNSKWKESPWATPKTERVGPSDCHLFLQYVGHSTMAHDACPYFGITGNKGELIIHGDGLLKAKPGAGGLRLYDEANPGAKELFSADRKGRFFLGFAGLWEHIAAVSTSGDKEAAHETVIRAAADVRVVLEFPVWESSSV